MSVIVSREGAELPAPNPRGSGALSVVIATRDRPVFLDACLQALADILGSEDEMIVVDSCSHGPDTAAVATRHGARLVRCTRPGASHARNAGWRAAAHHVVCFVDDDVRVLSGWADALRASFADEAVAFVTGRLGVSPGAAVVERPVAFLDAPRARVVDRDAVRDIGHGANLAIRRAALEAVGGFDEAFGPGAPFPAGEDMDLLDRLVGAGCVGRYEPGAAAWHLQWRTRRRLAPLEWSYGTGQGARLARLWAADRGRARAAMRVAIWDDGVADFSHCVRTGYRFGAFLAATRLAAMARGAVAYCLRVAFGDKRRHRVRTD